MNLRKFFGSMYVITILLLSILVVINSYVRYQFPSSLVVAVVTTTLVDLMMQKIYLKKKISFPFSATITGLIIGSVSPFSTPYYAIILASAVAILSKFFIKIKGTHVFNPATFGMIVSLGIFSFGDEWWGASNINFLGYIIPLSLILLISNYKAMKLKIGISFVITLAIFYIIAGYSTISSSNAMSFVNFIATFPFYFAFIMVSEPKTSPYGTKRQILFGVLVALLTFLFEFYYVKFGMFLALLIGNLAYSIYRNFMKQ